MFSSAGGWTRTVTLPAQTPARDRAHGPLTPAAADVLDTIVTLGTASAYEIIDDTGRDEDSVAALVSSLARTGRIVVHRPCRGTRRYVATTAGVRALEAHVAAERAL